MQDRESNDRAELGRIRTVYGDYATDAAKQRSWSLGPAHRLELERKWGRISGLLTRVDIDPRTSRLLDLGIYTGTDCPYLLQAGFRPPAIIALDLDERSIRMARARYRWLRAVAGDATHLPFADESFDVVYQSTVISSVLDPARREVILREAGRVLRPGGVVVSYDTRYPNPWNRNTRPLGIAELRRAFAGWHLYAISLTGIPQIIRALSNVSLSLCRLVEAMPVLRSHLLVVARKP